MKVFEGASGDSDRNLRARNLRTSQKALYDDFKRSAMSGRGFIKGLYENCHRPTDEQLRAGDKLNVQIGTGTNLIWMKEQARELRNDMSFMVQKADLYLSSFNAPQP